MDAMKGGDALFLNYFLEDLFTMLSSLIDATFCGLVAGNLLVLEQQLMWKWSLLCEMSFTWSMKKRYSTDFTDVLFIVSQSLFAEPWPHATNRNDQTNSG